MIIRPMQPSDLPAGLRLSQAVQWSHRLEDWQFHHRLGRGWVACDEDHPMLGTATWWSYGEHHGSVGLVLVEGSQQGKGIGRRLMDWIIDDAGSRSLQLVATPAGSKLYKQCGFREVGLIEQRQVVVASPVHPPPSHAGLREATANDLPALLSLDAAAFGASRHELIQHLFTIGSAFVATLEGQPAGFVMKRQAGRGTVIGPVVAGNDSLALALVAKALNSCSGFTRIDIPSRAEQLSRWLDTVGLVKVDSATTMCRGTLPASNTGARTYALVSQAFG